TESIDQRDRKIAAGAVATDRDVTRGNTLLAHETPGGNRVLMRCGIGMFGREPIGDCECSHARCAASLSDHAAMTDDRARAISPAVKEHQHARVVAAGHD